MIDFIEERIGEARQNRNSAKAALEEASCAIAFIEDRLRKEENDPLMVAFHFTIFHANLKGMDDAELANFIEKDLQTARHVINRFTS